MTPETPVPAYRRPEDAFRHVLIHDVDIPYRYAPAATGWAAPSASGGWAPVATYAEVLTAAKDAVREAVEAFPPPLAVRCVSAPRTHDWGARVEPWQTAAALETVTSWEEAVAARLAPHERRALEAWRAAEARRAEEHTAFLAAGIPADDPAAVALASPRPCPIDLDAELRRCISEDHREALLGRISTRVVDEALRAASASPAFRVQQGTPLAAWAPETFVAALREAPGARIGNADLYRAYVAQVPESEVAVPARRFHRLVRETLAPAETVRDGYPHYRNLVLPDDDPPRLRLVS